MLLPSYHAVRESHGREEAYRAYTSLSNRFLLALACIAVLAWLLAPQLTRLRIPGFGPADIDLAMRMFRWIVPLVVIQVATELLRTLANAERLYGGPETVSVAARLVSLVVLAWLASPLGSWALIVALWFGSVVEILGIVRLLRRREYRYRLSVHVPESARGINMFGTLGATLPYVGLTQLFLFTFDAALSHLPQGSFALFRYATMIWSRTQGIFLRPVSIPFFTSFSESAARSLSTTVTLTENALARILAVTGIVTTAVLVGAQRVLTALWQGEKFPPEKIGMLVWLLAGMYVLLPVAGTATILRKASVSMHRIRQTYAALAAVQVISTLLVFALVPTLGLPGALCVNALNMLGFVAAPLVALRVSGQSFRFHYPYDRAWRWVIAMAAGALVGLGIDSAFARAGLGLAVSRPVNLAIGCSTAAVGTCFALAVSLILKVPESRQLVGRITRICGSRAHRGR